MRNTHSRQRASVRKCVREALLNICDKCIPGGRELLLLCCCVDGDGEASWWRKMKRLCCTDKMNAWTAGLYVCVHGHNQTDPRASEILGEAVWNFFLIIFGLVALIFLHFSCLFESFIVAGLNLFLFFVVLVVILLFVVVLSVFVVFLCLCVAILSLCSCNFGFFFVVVFGVQNFFDVCFYFKRLLLFESLMLLFFLSLFFRCSLVCCCYFWVFVAVSLNHVAVSLFLRRLDFECGHVLGVSCFISSLFLVTLIPLVGSLSVSVVATNCSGWHISMKNWDWCKNNLLNQTRADFLWITE